MEKSVSEQLNSHDAFAADYDQLVRAYGWYGHDALFGLCFEYIHTGEGLLDVGIGTGLASAPFAKAGLAVSGFDSSLPMLKLCRAKPFEVELKHFDLNSTPWPYIAASFDHVISCGVLHFIGSLEPFFREVARIIRPGGIFAFTTRVPPLETTGVMQQTIDGIAVFSHSKSTVEAVSAALRFEILKCLKLSVGCGERSTDSFFAFVARKADG